MELCGIRLLLEDVVGFWVVGYVVVWLGWMVVCEVVWMVVFMVVMLLVVCCCGCDNGYNGLGCVVDCCCCDWGFWCWYYWLGVWYWYVG